MLEVRLQAVSNACALDQVSVESTVRRHDEKVGRSPVKVCWDTEHLKQLLLTPPCQHCGRRVTTGACVRIVRNILYEKVQRRTVRLT